MKPKTYKKLGRNGFTLVELMVVVLIIAVLASVTLVAIRGIRDRAKKVQALAQFRDMGIGMTMFEVDYRRPPIPSSKRDTGWDTIYGDPGGNYSTQFLISALAGADADYPYGGENFSSTEANPRKESYIQMPLVTDNRSGVGEDGKLYDPWGREVMVAVNGMKSNNPADELVDFNEGQNDRRLHTWGLAEYTDTKPREESFVFWSYGKDGKKGNDGENYSSVVPYKNSDDVKSW